MGLRFFRSEKGQTLIEVLAAFGIAVSLVSVITVTVIFALSTAQSGKNKNLATQYTQQGMELVRRLQDAGELQSKDDGTYCLNIGRSTLTSKGGLPNCVADANSFIREVIISSGASSSCGQARQIKVMLKWSDNKCRQDNLYCHVAETISCLSGINAVATPGQVVVSPTPTSTPTPTAAPPFLSMTQSSGYANLSWNEVSGAIKYQIWYCNGYCVPNNTLTEVTTTTYQNYVGTGCNERRSFGVKTVIPGGGVSSMSNTLTYDSGGCGDE